MLTVSIRTKDAAVLNALTVRHMHLHVYVHVCIVYCTCVTDINEESGKKISENIFIFVFLQFSGNTCLNAKGMMVKNDTVYDVATPGADDSCTECFEICWCPDWTTTPYNSTTQAKECIGLCTDMGCNVPLPMEDKHLEIPIVPY